MNLTQGKRRLQTSARSIFTQVLSQMQVGSKLIKGSARMRSVGRPTYRQQRPEYLQRLHLTSHTPRAANYWRGLSRFRDGALRRRVWQVRFKSDTTPSPNVTSQLGSPPAKLGLRDRLKDLFKRYGWVSVGVYFALSVLDFPFCFLAVRLAGPERIGQIEHRILESMRPAYEPAWNVIKPVAGPVLEMMQQAGRRVKESAMGRLGSSASTAKTQGMGEVIENSGAGRRADGASECHSRMLPARKGIGLTQRAQAFGRSLLLPMASIRRSSSSYGCP